MFWDGRTGHINHERLLLESTASLDEYCNPKKEDQTENNSCSKISTFTCIIQELASCPLRQNCTWKKRKKVSLVCPHDTTFELLTLKACVTMVGHVSPRHVIVELSPSLRSSCAPMPDRRSLLWSVPCPVFPIQIYHSIQHSEVLSIKLVQLIRAILSGHS